MGLLEKALSFKFRRFGKKKDNSKNEIESTGIAVEETSDVLSEDNKEEMEIDFLVDDATIDSNKLPTREADLIVDNSVTEEAAESNEITIDEFESEPMVLDDEIVIIDDNNAEIELNEDSDAETFTESTDSLIDDHDETLIDLTEDNIIIDKDMEDDIVIGNENDVIPKQVDESEINDDPSITEEAEIINEPFELNRRSRDFTVLYEIEREIAKANSLEELYDTILFTLMGQIGVSSASIMVPRPDDNSKWVIAESSGVIIENEDLYFSSTTGILAELKARKKIIDIEEFKENQSMLDDYFNYISVDARLMIPLFSKSEIICVILLGEKITSDEYSNKDKDFLLSISEISAVEMKKIFHQNKITNENISLKKDLAKIEQVDEFCEKLYSEIKLTNVVSDIREEFKKMGIGCYSIFIQHRDEDFFYPLITEKEDFLSLKHVNFKIEKNHDFARFINRVDIPITIDNFIKSDVVKKTFSEEQLDKISIFRIFPFLIGNNLLGFIVLFRIFDSADLNEIDVKLKRFSSFIFYHILNLQYLDSKQTNYVDNIETIFKRIKTEIANSKKLGIPLTIVMLSLKNYKRYYNLFGDDGFRKLFDSFEDVIKSRLSDNDFSLRYGRQKILIILPGKDKKYSVPLSNSICNEISSSYNNKEIQLLITSLAAEYPIDGNDLYKLIDSLE